MMWIGKERRQNLAVPAMLLFLLGLPLCCGCGNAEGLADVSGAVTYNGQPVTGGSLTFSPIDEGNGSAAKPGEAMVGPDGAYHVSTYGNEDGAAIGKHAVSYWPPGDFSTGDESEAPSTGGHDQGPPPSPFADLIPKQRQVEVKPGSNEINIELVKRGH